MLPTLVGVASILAELAAFVVEIATTGCTKVCFSSLCGGNLSSRVLNLCLLTQLVVNTVLSAVELVSVWMSLVLLGFQVPLVYFRILRARTCHSSSWTLNQLGPRCSGEKFDCSRLCPRGSPMRGFTESSGATTNRKWVSVANALS